MGVAWSGPTRRDCSTGRSRVSQWRSGRFSAGNLTVGPVRKHKGLLAAATFAGGAWYGSMKSTHVATSFSWAYRAERETTRPSTLPNCPKLLRMENAWLGSESVEKNGPTRRPLAGKGETGGFTGGRITSTWVDP